MQAPVTVQARYNNIDTRNGIGSNSIQNLLASGQATNGQNLLDASAQPSGLGHNTSGLDFDWLSNMDFELPVDGTLNPELFEFLGCHFPADDMDYGFTNGT